MNNSNLLKHLGVEDNSDKGPVWHRLSYENDAIIEASAGTGKTYALERIVLKLVCQKGYDIRSLLLVTFTEKAAGELKDRIRRILEDVGADMSHFDEATICTIHSFCRELLNEYPFESGMQMTLDVESSDQLLVKKAVHDTIAGEEFKAKYQQSFTSEMSRWMSDATVEKLEKNAIRILQQTIECGNSFGNTSPAAAIVDKVACLALDEFHRLKKQTKSITFDDMVHETSRVVADAAEDVNNPQKQVFLASIRKRYRIALVDEFQDTDDKQWTIFRTLFSKKHNSVDGGKPGCLIVVGDPKQSIYSFRGADVAIYLAAKQEIVSGGGQKFSLNTMFRSTREMVKSFNTMFKANDWFTGMRAGESAIAYDNDVLFPTEEDAPEGLKDFHYPEGESAVTLLESLPENETQGNRDKCLPLFMKNAAKEMIRLRKDGFWQKILPWHEMCVLVRSQNDANTAQKILRRCGIPCIRYKESGLFDSAESESVLALFDYFSNEQSEGNLSALLLTPFFRVTPWQIEERLKRGDRSFDALCDKWRVLIDKHEWVEFFESVMTATELGKPHPEDIDFLRRRTAIRQILDRLLSTCGAASSLGVFISTLRNWKRNDQLAGENGSLRDKESDADAVKIMTMHAAKGLEFGAVFIPWGFGLVVSSRLGADEKEREDAKQEMRRLVYVALTRAKFRLYLPWSRMASGNGFGSSKAALNGLFLANAIKKQFGNCPNDKVQGTSVVAEDLHWSEPPTVKEKKRVEIGDLPPQSGMHEWRFQWDSFSSLNHPENKESVRLEDGQVKDDDDQGGIMERTESLVPRGALSGTVFHEVMEVLCGNDESLELCGFAVGRQGFSDVVQETTEKKSPLLEIIRHRMEANGVVNRISSNGDSTEIAFARMIWNALRTEIKIGEDIFKLCDVEFKDRKAEVRFVYDKRLVVGNMACPEGAMNGSIDLIVRRPNGRYVILDWKTNALESYDENSVTKEMEEANYHLQYRIYSLAVEQWLGQNAVQGVAYLFVRGGEKQVGLQSGLFAMEMAKEERNKSISLLEQLRC